MDVNFKPSSIDNIRNADNIEKSSTMTPEVSIGVEAEAQIVQDWTVTEEKRVVWKLDLLLMPLLVLGFFALQLDRSNISNALTSTITTDLGISSDTINAGNQLQIAAIIIFEIPSNIILQKFGAPIWITGQCLLWGAISTFQAFIKNQSQFYATRFLLGMFEAGYIPGSMFVIALFYKRAELAKRTAIFYVGNYFAAGTGSLIAAGIFQISGRNGLSGWQWLFLIDGLFTMLVGIAFVFLLPHSPSSTLPLCKIKAFDIFSDRDRHILQNRVVLDDPHKETAIMQLTPKHILLALCDIRLWGHFAINVLSLAPKGGLALYSPTVIKALGFDTTNANLLSSVSNYGVIILSLLFAWGSDYTKLRGPWCLLAGAYSMIFAGAQFGIIGGTDKWLKYAIFTLLNSGNAVGQGLNDAWLSSNCETPQHRSIGLALAVMGSNIGGLCGQQLFRTDDAPKYNRAFLVILCLYGAALIVICGQMAIYWSSNRKMAKARKQAGEEDSQSGSNRQTWKYEL